MLLCSTLNVFLVRSKGECRGGEVKGVEVLWRCLGVVWSPQSLSVCEGGRPVMSLLAGPKAHWACEGMTWVGHRGVSPALFCVISPWRGQRSILQLEKHSLPLKSIRISSSQWCELFGLFLDSLQCRSQQEVGYIRRHSKKKAWHFFLNVGFTMMWCTCELDATKLTNCNCVTCIFFTKLLKPH